MYIIGDVFLKNKEYDMKTKSKLPVDQFIVRNKEGKIDLNQSVTKATQFNKQEIEKIIKEEQFDLSDQQIKRLCLSVFYARPDLKYVTPSMLINMAIHHIEVPARKYDKIVSKINDWINKDTSNARGSFKSQTGYVVLRSKNK